MTLEQLQNALNQQTAETNAVREILIAIKGFGSGEVSIEKVVKVYKDNRILLDDAVEKYLTGSSPIVYITQRGGFKLSKEHKQKISCVAAAYLLLNMRIDLIMVCAVKAQP